MTVVSHNTLHNCLEDYVDDDVAKAKEATNIVDELEYLNNV